MHQRAGWIPQLDGLRGIAALTVVVAHFNGAQYQPAPDSWYAIVTTLHAWSVALGAVSLFFALSAFLLTYLAVSEYDGTGSFAVWPFYRRRALRIWPLYFTIVALNLTVPPPWRAWMADHWWLYAFLSNWSLAFNDLWGHLDTTSPLIVILWSIAIEEQFYAVFPLAMLWLLPRARLTPPVLLTLIVVAVLGRYVFFVLVPNDGPGNGARLYYATTTYLDTFALGGAAGWLCARRPCWWQHIERGLRLPGAWVPIVAALAWLFGHWGGQGGVSARIDAASWVALFYGLLALALTGLIMWTVASPRAILSRFLVAPPLRWLGMVSYGLYVWHPYAEALVWQRGTDNGALMFAAYLVLTLGMAALSHRLIEQPFLKLKRRRLSHQAIPITVQV